MSARSDTTTLGTQGSRSAVQIPNVQDTVVTEANESYHATENIFLRPIETAGQRDYILILIRI